MKRRKFPKVEELRKLRGVPKHLTDRQLLAWIIIQKFKQRKRRQAAAQAKKELLNPAPVSGFGTFLGPSEAAAKRRAAPFQQPPKFELTIPNPNLLRLEAPKDEKKDEKKQREQKHDDSGKRRRDLPIPGVEILYDPAMEKAISEYFLENEENKNEVKRYRDERAAVFKQKHDAEDALERIDRERKKLEKQKVELYDKQLDQYNTYIWGKAAEILARTSLGKKRKKWDPVVELYAETRFPEEDKRKEFLQEWLNPHKSVRQIIARLGPYGGLPPEVQEIFDREATKLFREPLTDDERERYPLVAIQRGGGKLPAELDTRQIDQVLGKYPQFKGTIPHDGIGALLPKIKPRESAAFVINTDNHDQPGQHWQAVNISYPDQSVEYFDSFGRRMNHDLWPGIKAILNRIDAPFAWKFKENRKKDQDVHSENCGFFCIDFLVSRFRGKPFAEATKMSEADIEKFKTQYGPFKLISIS